MTDDDLHIHEVFDKFVQQRAKMVDSKNIKLGENGNVLKVQFDGSKANDNIETNKINVVPAEDYVPVRKINQFPMERPVIIAVRNEKNDDHFEWIDWFTKGMMYWAANRTANPINPKNENNQTH
ncbi:unnamed protein product [Caenorhabditis angaria]|uniref:Uncharacterized protein n=1 Tax=Caenorhabditis angaria TaxID=860376 RepID=A0A9P1NBS6_9PELO|nr:unnamed protein product [Caenorhabditis angaria]